MIHTLKTWPVPFKAVWTGKKTFELRKNDRGYQVGDILSLQEYDPYKDKFSGRSMMVSVDYVLQDKVFGLTEGFCCMSISINTKIDDDGIPIKAR